MTYRAKVARVIDGDTIVCHILLANWDGLWQKNKHVRLHGINCPERRGASRAAGEAAKVFVKGIFSGQPECRLTPHGDDNFGRLLADITLADGQDLATLLRETGHAEEYQDD